MRGTFLENRALWIQVMHYTNQVIKLSRKWICYAPVSQVRGHIVLPLSIRLSVCTNLT